MKKRVSDFFEELTTWEGYLSKVFADTGFFWSGTDHISSCCSTSIWGNALQRSLRLHRFKADGDEIWQDCSSSKYTLIDVVQFFLYNSYFPCDSRNVCIHQLPASTPSACDCHWLTACPTVPDPWYICTCFRTHTKTD